MGADAFRFDGKRAVVVGGASGMGAATASLAHELGAEVVAMDFAEVTVPGVRSLSLDLRDKAGIDAALEQCGGPIDALFSCAGAADGTPGIEKINFIGHRHLIDRALEKDLLPRGSAIGMISSAAGLGWEPNLELINEYLDTPDFEAAVAWIEAHPDKATYMWSKQAMSAYVSRSCVPLIKRGVRINAILPGPTDTPLARANAELWLSFGSDFREATGQQTSTPDQQAHALVFLCSAAASYVNGVTLMTDGGYFGAGLSGAFPAATPVVHYLLGRP
jgi:NAD(P)-dependent dehydrogenase (short-subunit alcohol dehydrogenase family)